MRELESWERESWLAPMMTNNGDKFPQNVAEEVFYQPGLINFSMGRSTAVTGFTNKNKEQRTRVVK